MNPFLPPQGLAARLDESAFTRRHTLAHLPEIALPCPAASLAHGRRHFLATAAALLSMAHPAAASAKHLISNTGESTSPYPEASAATVTQDGEELPLGAIPEDFWFRPRSLWIRRKVGGKEQEVQAEYWRDGELVPDGYWQICAILRDARENLMTSMDPGILDVMRGVQGYYEAWRWPHPIVATSGFRTVKTNNALASEGAAKNSMHLYGKGVDIFIPGIPVKDIASLGAYLQQGGVGFYPSSGFIHLDTGRTRFWRGK